MTAADQWIKAPGRWPVASLDSVGRLRALAAGLDGVTIEERALDARFGEVWSFISDLERSIPTFDRTVASIRILDPMTGADEVPRTTTGPPAEGRYRRGQPCRRILNRARVQGHRSSG